jgi:hypothetical protein
MTITIPTWLLYVIFGAVAVPFAIAIIVAAIIGYAVVKSFTYRG